MRYKATSHSHVQASMALSEEIIPPPFRRGLGGGGKKGLFFIDDKMRKRWTLSFPKRPFAIFGILSLYSIAYLFLL